MSITTPPSITALPTPPDPNDRATFNSRAYPWSVAQATLASEVSAVATNVYNNATEAQTKATAAAASEGTATTQAGIATTKAGEAAASAASALNAPGTSATSTTSQAIATGSKTVTIQTGKVFAVGQTVVLASAANVANQMIGQITAHNSGSGSLTVNVSAVGGSGTFADWIISLSALNPGTSVTWSGTQTFTGYKDTVYAITDTAGFSINPSNGAVQTITLGASRTPVVTNFASGQTVIVGINDGAGYAVTWSSIAPTWVRPGGAGAAPTLHTSGYTWVLLWNVAGTIYAAEIGKP